MAKKPQDPDFLNMVLDALKSQLPSYSIPELVLVNEIPTTIHGKADKERLIADHRASRAVDQASLPVTDIENVIRRHIGSSESLDMDKLFLTQGGTSLLAVRVIDDFKIVFPQMDTDCESKLLESLLHHPLAETARLLSGLKSNKKRKVDADQVTSNGKGGLSITGDLIWKVDLGKCIDASPIIHKGTAYIGSHSGRFVAVDTSSGSVIWSCVLPGRIEGTAVISRDGRFAVVGCYDGKLYYIDLRLGTISATFQTGGEIKCRPAIDSTTGAIWVGSYDHFLYGVSIAEDGVTISLVSDKIDLRAPLFSSPLIDSVRRRMFACSTAGVIHHMDLSDNNPCIICSKTMPKPIFSSPCLEPKSGDIIVGCTDGKIYRLTGSLATVWAFDTNGPVFSSPVLWKEKFVVCGSHSKSLVGLDLTSGNLNFKEEMGAPIFASPAPLHDSLSWVSINGVLVIRTPSGPDKSIQLPGEVFSSPLLAGNQVLVGCRNDKFYAISI